MYNVNGALELFAAMVAAMLLVSVQGESREQPFEKYLLQTIVFHMLTLLVDAPRWFWDGNPRLVPLMLGVSILSTTLALVSNALFVYCLIAYFAGRADRFRKILPMLWLFFITSIVLWSAFLLLNGEKYLYDAQHKGAALQYGWMFWASQLLWGAVCIVGICIIWSCRKALRRHELMALLSYCLFPVLALLLKTVWDASQIYLSTTLSLVLIHSVMYREHRRRLQEQEKQLEHHRFTLLLGQIQPHFLFNVLNTIYHLCTQDPMLARQAIDDLSCHLRAKLDFLQQSEPILFSEELHHVQSYLALEKVRFAERLEIVYELKAMDFTLPALCLQLLAENAVKHGVGKTKSGGTVRISSEETSDAWLVSVTDNGVGFDPKALPEGKTPRVGIENVRSRLAILCGGTLEITSEKGRGTQATMRIPKREPVSGRA